MKAAMHSNTKPSSDTVIEMLYESQPAKWAALQISTKGYGLKTVGEAMEMIEKIVTEAIRIDNQRYRSVTELASIHPNLSEYLRQIEGELAKHKRRGTPAFLSEALNSGDGTYKP